MGEAKSKKPTVKSPSSVAPRVNVDSSKSQSHSSMTYGKAQFKWMLIGVGFIVLGLLLMMGGGMPSPEVWDESLIYSPIRLTLAPLLILVGLGLQIFAIFKVSE